MRFALFAKHRRRRRTVTGSNLPEEDVAQDAEQGASAGVPFFLQPTPTLNSNPENEATEATQPSEIDSTPIEPLPNISGEGETHEMVAYANTLRLQGRTNASFSNNFTTQNVTTTRATGCEGCPANQCIHVTGNLASNFNVTTTVTLPRISDFPNLTPCQQQRVQNAITNILAPHEQQHVAAFQTYVGRVSTPFDLTLCRSDFDATIRSMHNSIEQSRRSSAQSASNALDPFHFDVNLDCSD